MKTPLRLFALVIVLFGLEAPSQATDLDILPVRINIHPGSDPNTVNANTSGVMPVAILSTPTFDATSIDPMSLELGVAPDFILSAGLDLATFEAGGVKTNKANRLMCEFEDVGSYDPDAFDDLGPGDGYQDLVCQFTAPTLFAGIEQPLQLTGRTDDGNMITFGRDLASEPYPLFTVVKCCIVCEDDGSCSGCTSGTRNCTDELVACDACEDLSECTGCEPPRVAQTRLPKQSFACLRP